jgi:Na+/phosphate symporter
MGWSKILGLVLMAGAVITAFADWNWIGAIFFGIAIFIFGKD